jgi:SNF2 family DNA or RNA helicase
MNPPRPTDAHARTPPRQVLVVLSVSLLKHWESQLQSWCPAMAVYQFHGPKRARCARLPAMREIL